MFSALLYRFRINYFTPNYYSIKHVCIVSYWHSSFRRALRYWKLFSILSCIALHLSGDDGMCPLYSDEHLSQDKLANNAWAGEGSIIAANVGEGSMVGVGSVITTNVKPQFIQ